MGEPRWRLLLLALLPTAVLTAANADTTRAFLRSDGGYDFFDLSGVYLGQSVPNEWGSYHTYDGQGSFTGWTAVRSDGSLEFFDAAGIPYRLIEVDALGQQVHYGPDGTVFNFGAPNYLGGVDTYDALLRPTGVGTSDGFERPMGDTESSDGREAGR